MSEQVICEICEEQRELDNHKEYRGYLVCDNCMKEIEGDYRRDQQKDDQLEGLG